MHNLLTTIFWSTFCLLLTSGSITAQNTSEEIQWYTLEEAVSLAEEKPKKLFIDVITIWCGWCKKMDKEVFSDPQVISVLNTSYYPVKLDAQQTEDIQFGGNTYEYKMYGQKGFNEFAVELLRGRMGFPSLVFLDEDLKIIQALEGYQKPERLELILNYFGENDYKKIPWTSYLRDYQLGFQQQRLNMQSIQPANKKKN